ncbi:MAG TPA: substrate-binding domain-containing protein, partial [Jatrophihabitantaceae bacterium]|nr:substrate-binding domain-containing protein [Jatrophihabitantaceae bacterium]
NRWYFAEVLSAVEAVLNVAGMDLLLYNLGDRAGRARFFEELPVRKRVDALLVASLVLSETESDALRSLGCPIGTLGVDHDSFYSTRIDDAAAASTAVGHLLELGHRRIALIGGDTADPMRFTPPHHRRRGYLQTLRAAGIDQDPRLEVLGYFTVDGGEAATAELLTRPDRPSALFAESDEMAFGAIRAIRRHGLRVPADIAVIGFDDQAAASLLDLSTIRQPVGEQAAELTGRLLAAVGATAQADAAASRSHVLGTELVVRGSTDPDASVY